MSNSFVSWWLLDKAICCRALASIHGPEIFWEFFACYVYGFVPY